jgi:hypothetical protein
LASDITKYDPRLIHHGDAVRNQHELEAAINDFENQNFELTATDTRYREGKTW